MKSILNVLLTLLGKNCGTPPSIPSGNVSYTDTLYGSYAVYTCIKGHDLMYNSVKQRSTRYNLRCSSKGQWPLAPTCQRKYLAFRILESDFIFWYLTFQFSWKPLFETYNIWKVLIIKIDSFALLPREACKGSVADRDKEFYFARNTS